MPISAIGLGLSLWNTNQKQQQSSPTSNPSPKTPKRASNSFGWPAPDDPDPFGVRALELAGLEIKEAGSASRPSIDAFDYRPSPTSPVFRLSTQSIDPIVLRDVKRDSKRSCFSLDQATQTIDSSTTNETSQITDTPAVASPISTEETTKEPEQYPLSPRQVPETIEEIDDEEEIPDEDDLVVEVTMPQIQVFNKVTPTVSKAKVVNIPRRGPPALPLRNPLRNRRNMEQTSETSTQSDQDDASSVYSSPTKSAFDRGEDSPNPWSEQTSFQDSDSVMHKEEDGVDADILHFSDRESINRSLNLDVEEQPTSSLNEEKTPVAAQHLTDFSTIKPDDSTDVSNNASNDLVNAFNPTITHTNKKPDDSDTISVSSYYPEDEESNPLPEPASQPIQPTFINNQPNMF
jgi:hypothetical protein